MPWSLRSPDLIGLIFCASWSCIIIHNMYSYLVLAIHLRTNFKLHVLHYLGVFFKSKDSHNVLVYSLFRCILTLYLNLFLLTLWPTKNFRREHSSVRVSLCDSIYSFISLIGGGSNGLKSHLVGNLGIVCRLIFSQKFIFSGLMFFN